MSTLDEAAIRLRAATWFRPGTQHPVERDVLDLLDEVKRLRAEVAIMREVACGNKRHVATVTTLLERVEALTVSTDGDDLDVDAEIPVGEIRRALTEPLPHEAGATGGDSTDG